MVLKLFGLGKKSDYYMEAPPADNGAEPTTAEKISATVTGAIDDSKKAVAAAAGKVAEIATDVVEEIKPGDKPEADKSKAAKSEVIKPEDVKQAVEAEAVQTAKPSAAKPQTKKLKKTQSAVASESQSAPAQPVVKAAPQPETTHFAAADGLMPLSTPRRRPGPSMAMFRDMAKDVKPRR